MSTVTRASSWNLRKNLTRLFQYAFLTLVAILVLIPIVMLAFGALKTRGDFMTHPYDIPIPPRWDNILGILSTNTFWNMLRNSLFVMVIVTAVVVMVTSLAAFVL